MGWVGWCYDGDIIDSGYPLDSNFEYTTEHYSYHQIIRYRVECFVAFPAIFSLVAQYLGGKMYREDELGHGRRTEVKI